MIIQLKYFGQIIEMTETLEEEFEFDQIITLGGIRDFVLSRYPDLKTTKFVCAVEHEIRENDFLINQSCEIALLPPFAGG